MIFKFKHYSIIKKFKEFQNNNFALKPFKTFEENTLDIVTTNLR